MATTARLIAACLLASACSDDGAAAPRSFVTIDGETYAYDDPAQGSIVCRSQPPTYWVQLLRVVGTGDLLASDLYVNMGAATAPAAGTYTLVPSPTIPTAAGVAAINLAVPDIAGTIRAQGGTLTVSYDGAHPWFDWHDVAGLDDVDGLTRTIAGHVGCP